MNKTVLYLLKVMGAGALAFCLLCVFAAFYYNPASHMPSSSGATDYIRSPDAFYAYMTEGYSIGKTDSGGFNNPGAMAGQSQSPDVLFMGSSHIEAMYVPQTESAPYVLNELLKEQGVTVYNIGMSSHTLQKCLRNLEAALETYRPQKYIVIENMSAILSVQEVNELYEGTQPKLTSYDKSMWQYWIQQFPYVKLGYEQYRNVLEASPSSKTAQPPQRDAQYFMRLEEILQDASQTAARYGCTLIIVYHPSLSLQPDGSAAALYSREDYALMEEFCKRNGIGMINMEQPFIDSYRRDYVMPNGFTNTEIGTGHLNRHGHRMIAESLYEIVGK